jgi:hypothetical protein
VIEVQRQKRSIKVVFFCETIAYATNWMRFGQWKNQNGYIQCPFKLLKHKCHMFQQEFERLILYYLVGNWNTHIYILQYSKN